MQRYNVSGIFDTEQDDNGELVLFVDAQAEIARLTAALADTEALGVQHGAVIERLTAALSEMTENRDVIEAEYEKAFDLMNEAGRLLKLALQERDDALSALATARAETAMAYEAAARWVESVPQSLPHRQEYAGSIRALTPAHATEALAADRKAVRMQALWDAASISYEEKYGDDWLGMTSAILALIEKETPHEAG